jgi:hypothetical protein
MDRPENPIQDFDIVGILLEGEEAGFQHGQVFRDFLKKRLQKL